MPLLRAATQPAPRSRAPQIRFFLLQNRQGKTRLSKWYVAIEEADKRKIEGEVRLALARRRRRCSLCSGAGPLLRAALRRRSRSTGAPVHSPALCRCTA